MERLKELRTKENKTQKDMAKLLKIDRTTYVKYEAGSNEPPFATLLFLAGFFHVSVDYLLGRTDVKEMAEYEKKPTAQGDGLDEALVNLLVDLSPAEAQRVKDFVSGLIAARTGGASRQE